MLGLFMEQRISGIKFVGGHMDRPTMERAEADVDEEGGTPTEMGTGREMGREGGEGRGGGAKGVSMRAMVVKVQKRRNR